MAGSFLETLDKEQQQVAKQVYKAAMDAGVDPLLAVSIAYQESRLRPNVGRGNSGEIGLMQVMPNTGKSMGFTEEDLSNPQKNIEAGVRFLRQALDATKNDPKLAAAYYNGGPGALQALLSGKEPDSRVINYVKNLSALGAFESQVTAADAAQKSEPSDGETPKPGTIAPSAPKQETDEERDARLKKEQEEFEDASERRIAQLIGGGVGAGVSAYKGAKEVVGSLAETAGRRAEMGKQAAIAAAPPPKGGLPTVTVPTSAAGVEPTSAQTTRILQGTTGDAGTTGRARMSGFAAETSQTAAAQKRAYELADQLRKMGVVTEDAPTFFAKQSGFTSSPSGVLIPRAEPPQTLGPRGPQGQIGGGRPPSIPTTLVKEAPALDIYKPISQTIKGGLDTVAGLFRSMMKPVGTAARYVAPPLALAGMAGEGVNIAQEMRKPQSDQDLTSLGLSGLNILGSGMSLFPPTMAVGIPLSLGTAAAQEYRKNPEFKQLVDEKLFRRSPTEGGLPVVP